MKRGMASGLRDFFRREDVAHGAGYAVLCGLIACAVVLGASVFGPGIHHLASDLLCDLSPNCAVALERDARSPAAEAARPVPAALEIEAVSTSQR
jgi:Flp pilus assembly pilin Flp